ncbi:glycoside hydrolase family 43 protein [Lapidilactobacillus luobeiensis]|uniref:glycoside hydrolase family 43 protein n=1 Tax=Lapidilactobacillus luobeiensis TaxID=2950371 RepID=UPI0021C29844|nr:glycoside hydrolase family 43 protein [Lapidilactobacillus luobeiensis]
MWEKVRVNWATYFGVIIILLLLVGCQAKPEAVKQELKNPGFTDVIVHDPSVIRANNQYYTIGSHMQMASTKDFIHWKQLSNSVNDQTAFTDIQTDLADVFEDTNSTTLWAGDIERLADGKYYMYYCACEGDNPTSVLGLAVADKVTGPYQNKGIFLRSGNAIKNNSDYDATKQPNVVDPHTFHDKDGKLWMIYGSYSGGIFILKMNEKTGFPEEGQGYGKRILGGNHLRIEGSYVLYNQQTDYYYLFLSFGGLAADGGYNLRVARSKQPDGPYKDSQGHNYQDLRGADGTTFDDMAIKPYGVKIMGNYTLDTKKPYQSGYISPGHNSAIYRADDQKYFLIFHTRFPNQNEVYADRVHQMFFTKAGWPVVTPLRYAGETKENYSLKQIIGDYQVIQMNKTITAKVTTPTNLKITDRGKIKGTEAAASLDFKDNSQESRITIGQKVYHGYFISQWDEYDKKQTMCFTGTDQNGEPLFLVRK